MRRFSGESFVKSSTSRKPANPALQPPSAEWLQVIRGHNVGAGISSSNGRDRRRPVARANPEVDMKTARRARRAKLVTWVAVVPVLLACAAAPARGAEVEGSVQIFGIHMDPYGQAAETYTRPGWGGGIQLVLPVPRPVNMLAGLLGFEYINLLNQTTTFTDDLTLLRVEQQTSQDYVRAFLGAELGGHGHGFVQPHVGVCVALVNYAIDTDVVIPDDRDRENEIRQDLEHESHFAFGYDVRGGLALNYRDYLVLDGGVRYLESFAVPQQLGARAITVHPSYFQVYLGIGTTFDAIRRTP